MTKKLTLMLVASAAALVAAAAATANSKDTTITGAGSSFVSPLVSTWTPAVGQAFGYTVQYSPVGSGAGIAAITNRQVDFGASDAPLTPDQATACKGCVQIPWALSATSVAYNVPGAPVHLHLDGSTLAKIFLGDIVNPTKSAPLAYPISTYTYVIVPQQSSHAAELRKLIFWALTQGQQSQYTAKLLFVPLPKPVLVASEKTLKSVHT